MGLKVQSRPSLQNAGEVTYAWQTNNKNTETTITQSATMSTSGKAYGCRCNSIACQEWQAHDYILGCRATSQDHMDSHSQMQVYETRQQVKESIRKINGTLQLTGHRLYKLPGCKAAPRDCMETHNLKHNKMQKLEDASPTISNAYPHNFKCIPAQFNEQHAYHIRPRNIESRTTNINSHAMECIRRGYTAYPKSMVAKSMCKTETDKTQYKQSGGSSRRPDKCHLQGRCALVPPVTTRMPTQHSGGTDLPFEETGAPRQGQYYPHCPTS